MRTGSFAAGLILVVTFVGCAETGLDSGDGSDSPLVGQPAPAFQLDQLSGGSVSLSNHQGSDIVILDFWATWCGPCREAMPTIIDVAGKYADKNVVLYAVNLQENEETIQGFLAETGLDVRVLLDRDTSVAAAYGANAIPQTVIIDQRGVVQAVHVGLTPDLRDTLTSQLESLVAGNRLAAR